MPTPANPFPRCAFVASGGGLKAYAFHLGALRAAEGSGFSRMPARGLPAASINGDRIVDIYIGSSAGACIAAGAIFFDDLEIARSVIGLAQSQVPPFTKGTLLRWNKALWKGRRSGGLFTAEGVESYFRDRAYINDFRELAPDFYICATQLNGSRKVVFGPKDSAVEGKYNPFIAYYNDVPVSDAIAASVSVPGLFRPYPIQNPRSGQTFEYIDGEVRETLSLHVARDNGADIVLISNTWMPYHYDPAIGSISQRGVFEIVNHAITQIIEQKVDRIRNEGDRYLELLKNLRQWCADSGFTPEKTEELDELVKSTLRYRPMREIYIAPDRHDTEFNLMAAWTFDVQDLQIAESRGYERACQALEAWEKSESQEG